MFMLILLSCKLARIKAGIVFLIPYTLAADSMGGYIGFSIARDRYLQER